MASKKEKEKTDSSHTSSSPKKVAEWLERRVKELSKDLKADTHNRDAAIEDLKFALGGDNQWNPGVIADRKAGDRPYLSVNLFPQYIMQVTGDIRHNRPRAKITPGDSQGDIQIARIREGIIADSEYQSNSDYIYVEAATSMVTCGYGAWRILTRHTEENPFIQEFYDELVDNPFTVVMDRSSKCPIYSDAKRGFILTKMPVGDFEKEYPDAKTPSDSTLTSGTGLTYENWYDSETVTVAEYYKLTKVKRMMCLMSDGSVIAESDLPDASKQQPATPPAAQPNGPAAANASPPVPGAPGPASPPPELSAGSPVAPPNQPIVPQAGAVLPQPTVLKRKEAEVTTVKHFKFTACDILSKNGLDGEDVPGSMVPIVLLTGTRMNIEGKKYIGGLVRNAKDACKNVNYSITALYERMALQPKAPWVATPRQIEGFQKDYLDTNTKNLPVLLYNPDQTESGQPLPPPMRQGMSDMPSGLLAQVTLSLSLFESAIGMNRVDLGGGSSQARTGAAVTNQQKPGDIRTFAYIDNLARGIAHGAKIKNEMIPSLYDTPRDVRLRGLDDTETYLPVNMPVRDAYRAIQAHPERYKGMNTTKLVAAAQHSGWDAKFNDITAGRYSVRVTVGPSYATQRQESSEYMLRLVSALPKQMGLGADLIAKNSGILDADILAERIKKTLPPGIAAPTPGEPPQPPMPPPPQAILMQAKVALEQERVKLQGAKVEVEKLKLINEAQNSKGEMKRMMIELLAEVMAPMGAHPADVQGGM